MQRVAFDRLVGVDPAYQIVATFGIAIVLQNVLLQRYGANVRSLDIGSLRSSSIAITDDLAIGWFTLARFLVAVAVLGLLSLFLARTRIGRAFRATRDDPARRSSSASTTARCTPSPLGLAFATVAIAGVFNGAQTTFAPASGPELLIYGFEAVIIGGLGSLWGTLAGGIILGVAQNLGAEWNVEYKQLIGHLVFLAVLVIRPTGLFGSAGSRDMSAAPEPVVVRPGDSVELGRARRRGRRRSAGCSTAPATSTRRSRTTSPRVCVFVTLATMWNLLAGYTGLVSIGQQAFVGLGGYGLIVVSNGYEQDIYFSVLPAGLIALGASAIIALVAFRLRGGYFAVGMWVIAEVVRLLVKSYKGDPIRGGTGTSLDASAYDALDRSQTSSLLALVVATVAVCTVYVILRSRLGLALQAVRDSESGASGLGVNVYRTRYRRVPDRRVPHRVGRRRVLPQVRQHHTRRRVQRLGVDGTGHRDGRHRRAGHHRGTDHRGGRSTSSSRSSSPAMTPSSRSARRRSAS